MEIASIKFTTCPGVPACRGPFGLRSPTLSGPHPATLRNSHAEQKRPRCLQSHLRVKGLGRMTTRFLVEGRSWKKFGVRLRDAFCLQGEAVGAVQLQLHTGLHILSPGTLASAHVRSCTVIARLCKAGHLRVVWSLVRNSRPTRLHKT